MGAHESLIRMKGAAQDPDTPRVEFNDEQRVIGDQATECPDFGREEVRSGYGVPMSPKESVPGVGR